MGVACPSSDREGEDGDELSGVDAGVSVGVAGGVVSGTTPNAEESGSSECVVPTGQVRGLIGRNL